jgi:predicted phage terminase large subunit-like protein
MSLHVDPGSEDAYVVEIVQRLKRRRERPELSTYEFAQQYRNFEQAIPAFQRVWYDALDAAYPRLLLLAPREHAKTSVVLTYALRMLVLNPQMRVGIISGTEDLARAFLRELKRELQSNRKLSRDFGGPFYTRGTKWTEHEVVVAGADHGKDVSVFCASVGSQVAGRHCDLLIFDDVETTDSVQTSEVRTKTRAWFAMEALPLLSPEGKAIVIGTRKHDDDLYGHLIRAAHPHAAGDHVEEVARGGPWRILNNALTAFDEHGDPIWPERWTRAALLARRRELDAIDIRAWPQEYENRPLPSGTQMFRPDEWPTWTNMPAHYRVFQAWDLAISEKQSADFTAGVTIGLDQNKNIYLLDCVYGHWDFHRQQQAVKSAAAKWQPELIGIEAVQYQAAAVQELARTSLLPVRPLILSRKKQRTRATIAMDKVARARLVEARAAAGKLLRPAQPAPWWPWLAEQFLYFPAGRYDDAVDALAYAVTMGAENEVDWAWVYGIHRCSNETCRHRYPIEPPGYPGPHPRPCPRCGTIPTEEEARRLDFDAYGAAGGPKDDDNPPIDSTTMNEQSDADLRREYGIHKCSKCRHIYPIEPPGYPGPHPRPCPRCGTGPTE